MLWKPKIQEFVFLPPLSVTNMAASATLHPLEGLSNLGPQNYALPTPPDASPRYRQGMWGRPCDCQQRSGLRMRVERENMEFRFVSELITFRLISM
jgi:hypothetical protein